MLKVEKLQFSYGKNSEPVLSGASLALQQGEIGILLGKNGSGKTTLFKNISFTSSLAVATATQSSFGFSLRT